MPKRRASGWFGGNMLVTIGAIFVLVPVCFWTLKVMSLAIGQNKVIYLPYLPLSGGRTLIGSPRDLGMPYEEVWLTTEDAVRLHCWFIPDSRGGGTKINVPTFLFFHGNAGNISHRLQWIQMLYERVGGNIMVVEYRGYGKSEGSPNEAGLQKDAQAALDYIKTREDVDKKAIFCYGHS